MGGRTILSIAIREGALLYRIDGLHLLAIAVIGGMLVMKDLRLWGWAMRGHNVSYVVEQLRVDARRFPAGCVERPPTGLPEPLRLYRSSSFLAKMGLMVLVVVHSLASRNRVYENAKTLDAGLTAQAKVAAGLSLILWAGADRHGPSDRLRLLTGD